MSEITPNYPISDYISRNRFQELYIRVRLARSNAISPYARASYTSLFGLISPGILLISTALGRPPKRPYSGSKYRGLEARKRHSDGRDNCTF
jgi:hypothetical protein